MLMQRELSNPFISRRQQSALQGACPNGGQWYACDVKTSSGFVGCCTVNACTSVGCAAGNLRSATLGSIPQGSTSDQACPFGGLFYTCVSPPAGANFWGCCRSAPCDTGCPTENLTSAALAQTANNPFAPSTSSSPGGSDPDSDSDDGTPVGAIVGGVVGGVLGLALVGVLIWWLLRKKRAEKKDAPAVPMAFNPHSQQADPGSNVPLTYPEVVDHYAGTSPQPTKQNFPPSAFTSPALPQYSDRRASHELGGSGGYDNGYISPMHSPGFVDQRGQGSRPMSYELHGTGSPGIPQKGMAHTPSIMSTAVSELPAEDMRYSQVSSMRYSGQPPASPPPPPPNNDPSGAGLGLSMGGQSGERTEN
ncbi:hypothetical protein TWF569_001018 [Orbilia oligospora]|uniref:Uncharacterized protein n=2 Tax=Orbilia oligospora TaxID=2813651 RepID=A0A7C8NY02_ORBOL|nr:hypothetical protein TWF103_005469 [Orbilia oligospora]KAF3102234.1 hypothetical protein TWF706_005378 [Orbilia oligospora]KAF3125245.1 hypothetical protein TWF569_001018 [Orbilia oligospora]KAF3134617.1 hypothetical protein TWF703_006274 [Orbilia oligospora]